MNGPERIHEAFSRAKDDDRAALIIYLMAGDPDAQTSADMVVAAAEAGADLIEIGIPFSDPLADGPTIQAAGQRALAAGMTVRGALELAERVTGRFGRDDGTPGGPGTAPPLLFMTYYNVVLHHGLERFVADAVAAGVSGAIIPDLPPDEAAEWAAACGDMLAPVFLVAPTSTPGRIAAACEVGRGFMYAVSTTGVTGARKDLPKELPEFVARVREKSGLPVAVGFGVSTPEQAREVGAMADGVIVGSAVIDAAAKARDAGGDAAEAVGDSVGRLAAALKR
jgi:tryptophan synthase alpha chain